MLEASKAAVGLAEGRLGKRQTSCGVWEAFRNCQVLSCLESNLAVFSLYPLIPSDTVWGTLAASCQGASSPI